MFSISSPTPFHTHTHTHQVFGCSVDDMVEDLEKVSIMILMLLAMSAFVSDSPKGCVHVLFSDLLKGRKRIWYSGQHFLAHGVGPIIALSLVPRPHPVRISLPV